MPEPRFQIKFKPNSQTALNQVKNFVENRLGADGVTVRLRDFDWTGSVADGIAFSIRIPTRAKAEALIDFVRDNISQLSSRGTGVVSFHLCSHDDDEVFDCVRDERAHYREHRF
jgi:hypothetical protein